MHFTNVAVVSSLVAGSSATLQYKRGLAANDDIPIGQFGGSNAGRPSHITWQYNWDSTTTNKKPFTDEYVPLLWGTQDYHTNQWHANAQSWINKGTTHLMSFNEPERPDQANLTPAAAVAAYKQYMQPFAGTARLGAPAVSNDGHDWIVNFLNQCNGCEIDFIPVHWYNDYTLEADFENWVHQICNLPGNRPVWITEFQAFGTDAQQQAFLQKAIPFLDNLDCVARYSYFGTADNSKVLLQNGGPALSALGVEYTYHL